jgi:hypothetical protein
MDMVDYWVYRYPTVPDIWVTEGPFLNHTKVTLRVCFGPSWQRRHEGSASKTLGFNSFQSTNIILSPCGCTQRKSKQNRVSLPLSKVKLDSVVQLQALHAIVVNVGVHILDWFLSK